MKKAMILTISLALSVGMALGAGAQGLPSQFAGTPVQKDYPKADILVLSETHAYTLLPDGRAEYRLRLVEKILNYEGIDVAGDPKVPFNSRTQELKIARSRTYTPWGTAVDTKANGFTEMTPYALEKSPSYADIRQMVITHIGLDVNAVIETEYTVADRQPWRRHLEGLQVLRNDDPALVREVVVTVPAGTSLKYATLNSEGEPARSKSGGSDVYTWTWKDVPAVRTGDATPEEKSFLPTLIFSTCQDWAGHAGPLAARVEKAVGQVSTEMEKKLQVLLKGEGGEFEKVLKIHDYVVSAIKSVDWPLADFDYSPRDASAVFDSGYGHSLDKAVLLAAFLKKAGFDPTVGAAGPPMTSGGDVPCLSRLQSAMVRVEMGKSWLLMDPTAKLSDRSRKDFTDTVVLPFRSGFTAPHPITAEDAPDVLSVSLNAKVAEDLSMEGQCAFLLEGCYSPYYKVQGSEDSLKEFAGGILGSVLSGAEVTAVSTSRLEPGRTAFRATFKAKAPKGSGPVKALKLGLPDASILPAIHGLHRSERDVPVVLPGAGKESLSVKLTLDDKAKPKALPKPCRVENAAGQVIQEISIKDGVVCLDLDVSLPRKVIPAADYPALKAMVAAASAPSARIILF